MINDCCVLPLTFSEWKHSLIGSCFYLPVWWAEGQASVFAGRSRELLFFRGTQGREEPRQDLMELEPESTLNECPGCVPCRRERELECGLQMGRRGQKDFWLPVSLHSLTLLASEINQDHVTISGQWTGQGVIPTTTGLKLRRKVSGSAFPFYPSGTLAATSRGDSSATRWKQLDCRISAWKTTADFAWEKNKL